MIKGILKNGRFRPTTPIPSDWEDGTEVLIEAAPAPVKKFQAGDWIKIVESHADSFSEEDHQKLTQAINEHRAEQKKLRRELG